MIPAISETFAEMVAAIICSYGSPCSCIHRVKPRLHQIHVAGYKYPGRATCIPIQVNTCRRNGNFVADTG